MNIKEIVFDRTNEKLITEVLKVSHTQNVSRKQAYSIVVGACREFDNGYEPYKNYESFRVAKFYKENK